jgi:hypothetical protein
MSVRRSLYFSVDIYLLEEIMYDIITIVKSINKFVMKTSYCIDIEQCDNTYP